MLMARYRARAGRRPGEPRPPDLDRKVAPAHHQPAAWATIAPGPGPNSTALQHRLLGGRESGCPLILEPQASRVGPRAAAGSAPSGGRRPRPAPAPSACPQMADGAPADCSELMVVRP